MLALSSGPRRKKSFASRRSCSPATPKPRIVWGTHYCNKVKPMKRAPNSCRPIACCPRCRKRSMRSAKPPRSKAMPLPPKNRGPNFLPSRNKLRSPPRPILGWRRSIVSRVRRPRQSTKWMSSRPCKTPQPRPNHPDRKIHNTEPQNLKLGALIMEPTRSGFFRGTSAILFYAAGFVLLSSLVAQPLLAAEPSSRNLDSGWQFRATANVDRSDVKDWHPAQVPGVVQTDLLHNQLIPDPFDRDNEFHLQWIGLADWEYQTTFQLDAAALAHDHVDLVFEGLDTFADVYLNGQSILQANNMFRRWRISAKGNLKAGPNALRIVFHSAVEKMIPYAKSLPYILPSISTHNYGNEENIATAPYTRKAPYNYGWDWGPRFMTEGIWQPVRLETWDALRIENFHIHQQSITADLANVAAELEIEASRPTTATLMLAHDELSGAQTADGTQTLQLDAGMNHVSFPIRIAKPKLWYPVGYGAQSRYRFSAAIRTGREVAAQAQIKTGLRSVELRRVPDEWGKSFEFVE